MKRKAAKTEERGADIPKQGAVLPAGSAKQNQALHEWAVFDRLFMF